MASRARARAARDIHLRLDVVVLELLVEGRAIDFEDGGGLGLVAAGGGEGGEDALLLELAEGARGGRARRGGRRWGQGIDGDGGEGDAVGAERRRGRRGADAGRGGSAEDLRREVGGDDVLAIAQ